MTGPVLSPTRVGCFSRPRITRLSSTRRIWHLKTMLPPVANIYGIGEHSESPCIDATNTTCTPWPRNAYGIPYRRTCTGTTRRILSIVPVLTPRPSSLSSSGLWNGREDSQRQQECSYFTLENDVIGGVINSSTSWLPVRMIWLRCHIVLLVCINAGTVLFWFSICL
jgi:hypothetical protein